MSKNARRTAKRQARAAGAETALQALARQVRDMRADQAAALAGLHAMRLRLVNESAAASLACARSADGADKMLELDAESAGGWTYGRGDTIIVFADVARQAIDEALRLEARVAMIEKEITAIDRLIAASPGVDRQGADGPTREMLLHIRSGEGGNPVARLVDRGHLNADDKRDLEEIERIWRYVSEGRGARIMDYGVKPEVLLTDVVSERRDYDFFGLLHAKVYSPWWGRAGIGGRIALDLATSGDSLDDIRRRHRLGWATAAVQVKASLKLYRDIRRTGLPAGE